MPHEQPTPLSELANFVRVRRLRLDPTTCGLHVGHGRRRTAGLRREELGHLAGLSGDWIARLEQGRDIKLSRSAAGRLAHALRLDAVETEHMLALCDNYGSSPPMCPPVSATLQEIVQRQGSSPAYVSDDGGDILTWNLAADLVFGPLSRTGNDNINLLRFMFLDPDVRSRFVDWEHHAWRAVAQFRLEYDRQPASEKNKALVDELRSKSAVFERIWSEHGVLSRSGGRKVVRHPKFGELAFDHGSFRAFESPALTLTIFIPTVEHRPSYRAVEEALERQRSLGADCLG